MAKSRKTPQLVNFDGERVAMTRDVYEFSNRRRKTLLARLEEIPGLEPAKSNSYVYKDERGRLLGFVTVSKGELLVDGNSVARTDRISSELRDACEGVLTFVRRANQEEVLADARPQREEERLITDLDQPIMGIGKSMRELLEDPETFAQLQAQMPPGVDLSSMLLNDNAFGNFYDDDFEDEESGEISDGFRTLGLRLDLLDEAKSGLYWCLKVPEWLTLGALHRVFTTLLGRSASGPFEFHLPHQTYTSQDKGDDHPDRMTLRRAFDGESQAFYSCGDPQWTFLLRRARVFSLCRGTVELVRTEIFPPGGSSTPEEYLRRLKAKELPRSEPFEVLERRLQSFLDPSASRVGPYLTHSLSLPMLLFAILLERRGEPASLFELAHRAFFSDCSSEISLSTVRRATKKAPFVIAPDERVTLDSDSPAYAKALSTLRKSLAPVGPRLMVRRFASQTMSVKGELPHIVLVVDDQRGRVHGTQVCHASDGVEPMLEAIEQALERFPEAVSVVTDDPLAREFMLANLGAFTDFQLSVDEPVEAFLTLEQHSMETGESGGYSYPSGLSQAELVEFCAAAQRYHLLCPWVFLSDADVFEIEGLTPKPLVASVLGQGHQVYGLGLYEGVRNYRRFRDGEMEASFAFMDFLEASTSSQLRAQIRQAGGKLLDDDTCPFAYGIGQPATATQFRILTEALNLICDRVAERGQVEPGTTEQKDSKGRAVRLTFPVDTEKVTELSPSSPESKPGRNDPCWCGSGKKYKKCHLGLDG